MEADGADWEVVEDVMVENMETDSGDGDSVEHKLRRLLHIGDTSASIQLQGGYKRLVSFTYALPLF